MEFIENEEALGRHRFAEHLVVCPIPPHPFPFLKLPREVRDKIYYYALLEPDDHPTVSRLDVCEIYKTRFAPSTRYWGSEEATRLFRVCHQVSIEALEIFYSRFTFRFATLGDPTFVKATLQHTLTVWARSLLGRIEISINLRSNPGPFTLGDEEKWRQTIETIRQSLPNIRRARVYVSVVGHDVPEHQVKSVVERALRMIHPLTDLTGVFLEGSSNETVQRTRIIRELHEALRSG